MSWLASLTQRRSSLRKATTVVTTVEGKRFVEGSGVALPGDWVDEAGNFAILDESAATGVSGGGAQTTHKPRPCGTETEALLRVVAEDPRLAPYLRLIKQPIPREALKGKIMLNVDATAADNFMRALGPAPAEGALPKRDPFDGVDWTEMHGWRGSASWPAPRLATRCDALARPGYASAEAHEFLDAPEVLEAKIDVLADMVRNAQKCVVYAGAGLSTSAGIGDYATQADGVVSKHRGRKPKPSPLAAEPSRGHLALAALANTGHVERIVQQNHDGLPQKAGVPQRLMNEIHGSWYDPSNPVVPMSGSLRGDLFADLEDLSRASDCVLALGSSLCGMNADQLVSKCADRARRDPRVPGSAIVSIQRTPYDGTSSLRIFALLDDVLEGLAARLGARPRSPSPRHRAKDVFRTKSGATLDLRDGAELTIGPGPNEGQRAVVLGKNAQGHYRVAIDHQRSAEGKLSWREVRLLGSWWVDAAIAGDVARLPVVNSK